MNLFRGEVAGIRQLSNPRVVPAMIFLLLALVLFMGGYALKKAFDAQRLLLERQDAMRDLQPWLAGRELKVPSGAGLRLEVVSDGELLMGLTFNPNEPANLVASGELPPSTIAWQHSGGTIGNTHC